MSDRYDRLERITECIDNIDFILHDSGLKLTQAIEDKVIKPAIRMNIIRIAEQFARLKDDNAFEILQHFSNEDLRGISAVRNYIAHDYDSTDDQIIDDVVRYNLPILRRVIQKIHEER